MGSVIHEQKDDVRPMPQTQDSASGQYDHRAWNEGDGPTVYDAPANTWEQRAIRQAVVVATMPRSQVRRLVRPPLPQVGAVRNPRREPVPTPEIIFREFSRTFPDFRSFFSGSPAGYQGSPRNMDQSGPY